MDLAAEARRLRALAQSLDDEIMEKTGQRDSLNAAADALEGRGPAPRRIVITAPMKAGEPSMADVILKTVQERGNPTTSEVATHVVIEMKDRIVSEDPRRVALTRIGQLVSNGRLVKEEETKRLSLPTNGNGRA